MWSARNSASKPPSVETVAASGIMSDPEAIMGAAHAHVRELIAAG